MRWISSTFEEADLTLLDIVTGAICVGGIAYCWIITS